MTCVSKACQKTQAENALVPHVPVATIVNFEESEKVQPLTFRNTPFFLSISLDIPAAIPWHVASFAANVAKL